MDVQGYYDLKEFCQRLHEAGYRASYYRMVLLAREDPDTLEGKKNIYVTKKFISKILNDILSIKN